MKILDNTVYKGRNIYSHHPVIKMILDIGKYSSIPTNQIEGFNQKLLDAFPGLRTNTCGTGHAGGFLEKLEKGTYLAHVLEHVILEMQFMAGYDVRYGKTRCNGPDTEYYIVYEYQNEVCGLECGRAACYILCRFLENKPAAIGEMLDYIRSVSQDAELGPSTSAIVVEAAKRNIPVVRYGNDSILYFAYGKYRRTMQATLTDATSCISADMASCKQLTKNLLSEYGIPVPEGKLIYSEISAIYAARQIGLPVAVKPHDSNQGKGVHLNIAAEREIKSAFRDAIRYSSGVIIEKYIKGKDFRVLVIGNRVCAVSERLPAAVIGDGIHTIEQLVELINQDENRGIHHEKPLTKIKLDDVSVRFLKARGATLQTVPANQEIIRLRENGNLSTGGVAIDRTESIHPENAQLAVQAAAILGIDIAGVDFVAEDISVPIRLSGGAIVEVNTSPGIRMHMYPSQGKPRNVAKDIVDYLYPKDDYLDFPIVSVTGTNGKTTTARLIAYILQKQGRSVGLTTTTGTYVNGKCIHKGDNTGPVSAKMLLSSKQIDAAVLETARGGILRSGLGYDLADVGIITNIAEDHLGAGSIQSLEDLAFVKSLVAEAVKQNGCVVLNADDPMTDYVINRVRTKILFFSMDFGAAAQKYASAGHTIICCQNGQITIREQGSVIPVAAASDFPITGGGAIACNIANCMAAAAALYFLGVPVQDIASGLHSFTENPGRFSIYHINNFSVLLDYAHNPPGYKAVMDALPSFHAKRLVGIIGMPGDRTNSSIQAAGAIAAEYFDKLYIKEDADLRGRKKGEVAGLFYSAVCGKGFPQKDVRIMDNELSALREAIGCAQSGDLIVVFFENSAPLVKFIEGIRHLSLPCWTHAPAYPPLWAEKVVSGKMMFDE